MSGLRIEKVRPWGNWVLIRIEERRQKSGGLFLLGESKIDKIDNRCGRVIAVGPGIKEKRAAAGLTLGVNLEGILEQELPIGSRVCFRIYLADLNPIAVDDEPDARYALIHFCDILAIVDETVEVGLLSGLPNSDEAVWSSSKERT